MALNLYSTVQDLRRRLSLEVDWDDNGDERLETWIEAASRWIDQETRRYFYTKTATIYANTFGSKTLILPEDLLSMTTLTTDSEADGTYDGETWTESTDFWLWPDNSYPKMQVHTTEFGTYSFTDMQRRFVKMIGTWGYGDGTSAPWKDSTTGAYVADASTETVTLDAEDFVLLGHTIKIDSEQMYVKEVSMDGSVLAKVTRGVNGTTAVAHTTSGTTVYLAQYPAQIKQACENLTIGYYNNSADGGEMESEQIGDYRYKRRSPQVDMQRNSMMVASFRKEQVAR